MFMKKSTQLLWGGFLKQEAFLQTQASFITCWQCSNCYSGFHLLRTLWYVAWWWIHFLYANFEYNQDINHTLWLWSGWQNPRQQWNNKLLQGTGFLQTSYPPWESLCFPCEACDLEKMVHGREPFWKIYIHQKWLCYNKATSDITWAPNSHCADLLSMIWYAWKVMIRVNIKHKEINRCVEISSHEAFWTIS